jgi:site-specific DNA recombinase
VQAGGVSVVLAQDRDRFAREPAYHYLLRKEFEEHGTKIRALNDRGDESPEGELTDGILDQLGKYERAKIAERTRRGKLKKARNGNIVNAKRTRFGFRATPDGKSYEVDEEQMEVVRRIFRMVGVEKAGIRTVIKAFKREGVPTPTGKSIWVQDTVRKLILEDSYKPHTFEELKEILSESVLATLDPTKAYGVYYFNRERITRRQVAEETPEGRVYRKKSKRAIKDRSEWIAIPVPDAGIPREWVDAARRELDGNKQCSKADDKFWELSGGIMRCGYCGRRMTAQVTSYKRKDGRKSRYHYYRCQKAVTHKELCPYRKSYNANKLEEKVWDLVSDFLKDPERLRAGLEEKIRREEEAASLNRNPEKQIRVWRERIAAGQEKRRRYQEMAAEGLIDFDELRERISELDEEKRLAEEEINALRRQNERLEAMRRDKDTLLARLMELTPEEMDKLSPEQRHWIYRRLGLAVTTRSDDTLDIYGQLTDLCFGNVEVASRCRGRP